jgi:hypothetical protein
MSGIDKITIGAGSSAVAFDSARRVEALGAPIEWNLITTDARVFDLDKPGVMSTSIGFWCHETSHNNQDTDAKPEIEVKGPFQNHGVYTGESPREFRLKLTQTVPDEKQLACGYQAVYLKAGEYDSWLQMKGALDDLLVVSDKVLDSLGQLSKGLPAVVLRVNQSSLDTSAWLAWAASRCPDAGKHGGPFWIIGQPGIAWRLVSRGESPEWPLPEDAWRIPNPPNLAKSAYLTPCLSSPTRFVSYQFRNAFETTRIEKLLGTTELPARIEIDRRSHTLFARQDLFTRSSAGWQSVWHLSDVPPSAHWEPSLFPGQRIWGKIKQDWKSGSTIPCVLEDCDQQFPATLTSCDAGGNGAAGWQWVPSKDNCVAFDTEWALIGLPTISYAVRTEAVDEPYYGQPQQGKPMLYRFGERLIRLFGKGVQIE